MLYSAERVSCSQTEFTIAADENDNSGTVLLGPLVLAVGIMNMNLSLDASYHWARADVN